MRRTSDNYDFWNILSFKLFKEHKNTDKKRAVLYKGKWTSVFLCLQKYWALFVTYIMQGFYKKKYGNKTKTFIPIKICCYNEKDFK